MFEADGVVMADDKHPLDYEKKFQKQKELLENIPTLIMWGMKDIAFREKELKTWMRVFTDPKVMKFENVGHFVQEEKGNQLSPIIEEFLTSIKA